MERGWYIQKTNTFETGPCVKGWCVKGTLQRICTVERGWYIQDANTFETGPHVKGWCVEGNITKDLYSGEGLVHTKDEYI